MAFQKLQKAQTLRGVAALGPQLTIAKAGTIGISLAAWRALGEPAAIHLEWDPEEYLLRVVASSPDDPAAYELAQKRLKFGAQALLRQLGLNYGTGTHRFPLTPTGRIALTADLTPMPRTATSGVLPMRKAS